MLEGEAMKCALCSSEASEGRKLCEECTEVRLMAASADRILRGTGLTYSNAERFKEDRWIERVRAGLRGST